MNSAYGRVIAASEGDRRALFATTARRVYERQFALEDGATLFGPKAMLEKIRAGEDPAAFAASWAADEATWRLTRAPHLLY